MGLSPCPVCMVLIHIKLIVWWEIEISKQMSSICHKIGQELVPWKHILGTVHTVSEDWQEAPSRNFYLMLKDGQQLVMRSGGGVVVVIKRNPGLGREHVQRPGVPITLEKGGNAISFRSLDHKIGLA